MSDVSAWISSSYLQKSRLQIYRQRFLEASWILSTSKFVFHFVVFFFRPSCALRFNIVVDVDYYPFLSSETENRIKIVCLIESMGCVREFQGICQSHLARLFPDGCRRLAEWKSGKTRLSKKKRKKASAILRVYSQNLRNEVFTSAWRKQK